MNARITGRFPPRVQEFCPATALRGNGGGKTGPVTGRSTRDSTLVHQLRRDRTVAWRFMVKHLAQVACIHTLSAHATPVRQFALMGKGRVELFRDSSGEGIVELERVEVGFASCHASSTHRREIGSRGNLGIFGADAACKATLTTPQLYRLMRVGLISGATRFSGGFDVRTFSRTAGRPSRVVLRRSR